MNMYNVNMTRTWICLTLLALVAARADAAVQLLNGGFTNGVDTNPDVWVENSLELSCRHTWGSKDGDGYLMGLNGWAGGAGTFAAFHQDVANVVAGNTYALSFWQEGDGGWNGSDVTGRLLWLNADDDVIGGVTTNLDAYTAGGVSWTRIVLAGVAPAGAVGARVQFDASILPSGGSGAAKFDAMSLAEYTGLLLNPGFAHGNVLDADFWTEHPTTEDAGREGWGSDDGDGYLMALPAYKSGTFGAFYQDVPGVKPGFRYTLTFSAAGEPPYNGSNVTARLIWLNNAMTPIASTTKDLDAYVNAWEWTRGLTLESVSPDGATHLRVQFDAESPASGAAAAKFDAFTLTRVAIPGTLIAVR